MGSVALSVHGRFHVPGEYWLLATRKGEYMTHCHSHEFPSPPSGKTGWPWTFNKRDFPAAMANGQVWPKISIVTPSYNQGRFIEETIRSVLLQGYPNLEYIVIDGGSNDETVEIIRRYDRWISSWTSKPDRGQVDALNQALPRTTGAVMNWLNSDDLLLPGALFAIAELFSLSSGIDIVTGARLQRSARTGTEVAWVPWLDKWPLIFVGFPLVPQEATFFSRRVWRAVGEFDEGLDYAFDGAFFSKAIAGAEKIVLTAAPIGVMNAYLEQKSLRKDDTMKLNQDALHKVVVSGVAMAYKPLVRLCFTRFSIIGESILRCVVYQRARSKFRIGEYDWRKDEWVLTPL
jgi:glycosyltransferase involved in cell wall biosynthesis